MLINLEAILSMRKAEKVIASRKKYYNFHQYLVKWEGYSIQHSTWHTRGNLKKVEGLVEEFEKYKIDNLFSVKIVSIMKKLDGGEESEELEEHETLVVKDRRKKKTKKVSQILQRKEQNNQVSYLAIKNEYHAIWVSQDYLLKECPQKLCKFYETYFTNGKKRKKYIATLPNDFKTA